MALKSAAGWNQTENDWALILRFEPDGCFGMEDQGRIVATATAACYGNRLGWIGMVLTLPEYRGQGLGRVLTQAAVDYAAERTRVIRLDASDMGRPIYERMGFVAECPVERWRREPGAAPSAPEVRPVKWSAESDTEVFGADRSFLLEEYARGEAASVEDGYAFGRPGANAPFFGPCVAGSPEAADKLLRWYVALHAGEPVMLDLFPHHKHAARIASALGFAPARRLTRMVLRPVPPELPDPRVYATGSFSWG